MTPDRLAAMRARHREVKSEGYFNNAMVCANCCMDTAGNTQPYPCDAAVLLARITELDEVNTGLRIGRNAALDILQARLAALEAALRVLREKHSLCRDRIAVPPDYQGLIDNRCSSCVAADTALAALARGVAVEPDARPR